MKIRSLKVEPGYVHEYRREISGRCHKCNVRFIWPRGLEKLSEMPCPRCGGRLHGTTHLFKGETIRLVK